MGASSLSVPPPPSLDHMISRDCAPSGAAVGITSSNARTRSVVSRLRMAFSWRAGSVDDRADGPGLERVRAGAGCVGALEDGRRPAPRPLGVDEGIRLEDVARGAVG